MSPDVSLVERLHERLRRPLPDCTARRRFEPELSYGRHFGPVRHDARRAVVVILLHRAADAWQLPLILRPSTMSHHAGQISLPGGSIDPGESPQEAVLRELEEELGVPASQVELLGFLSPLQLFVSNFTVAPYVAAATGEIGFRINPAEVRELLLLPVAELVDPKNHSRHQRVQRGIVFDAPHIALGRRRIWGATAIILGELIALLDEALDD